MKINLDKSGANTAAIGVYNKEAGARIEIRQCKYINNIVEQDHRRVKQKTRAELGFKAFSSGHATLQGAELIQKRSGGGGLRRIAVCDKTGSKTFRFSFQLDRDQFP